MTNTAIFSVPRSGSSWLGEIFNSSPDTVYRFQPNFAYSFPLTLSANSNHESINQFNHSLWHSDDPFVCDRLSISGKQKSGFPKNNPHHLVWKETHFLYLARTLLQHSNAKVVGLVRSPLATIASWINIPREFDPSWSVNEQWRTATLKNQGRTSHYFGFDKWVEAAQLFESLQVEYPDRFYLVRYEDLLQHPMEAVDSLFNFVG